MRETTVVQVGTHEALLAQAGLYRELYERQFREEPTNSGGVVAA